MGFKDTKYDIPAYLIFVICATCGAGVNYFPEGVEIQKERELDCFELGLLCFVTNLRSFGCKIVKSQDL